jgi:hypothetical protein
VRTKSWGLFHNFSFLFDFFETSFLYLHGVLARGHKISKTAHPILSLPSPYVPKTYNSSFIVSRYTNLCLANFKKTTNIYNIKYI